MRQGLFHPFYFDKSLSKSEEQGLPILRKMYIFALGCLFIHTPIIPKFRAYDWNCTSRMVKS